MISHKAHWYAIKLYHFCKLKPPTASRRPHEKLYQRAEANRDRTKPWAALNFQQLGIESRVGRHPCHHHLADHRAAGGRTREQRTARREAAIAVLN